MLKHEVLTDLDLDSMHEPALRAAYKRLREHHVEETSMLTAKDRGLVLRMAGNIAAGIARHHVSDYGSHYSFDRIAEVSIGLARALVKKADER